MCRPAAAHSRAGKRRPSIAGQLRAAARWTDWSIDGALTLLENYNGLGYAKCSPAQVTQCE